jgi:hypothetical protein
MLETSILEDQVRECFGRVVYTHKTHEKMAEECSESLRRYKIWQIAISALTASGALSVAITNQSWLKIGTALSSFLAVWISGYMKGVDPGGTAQKHRDAASALWPIRESYLSLLTDVRRMSISDEDATKIRDDLQKRLATILKSAPQTNAKAYIKAQMALKCKEEYTFSASEIDKFVPASLRKGSECRTPQS